MALSRPGRLRRVLETFLRRVTLAVLAGSVAVAALPGCESDNST